MTACASCGMDIDRLVRFGPLSVSTEPPAATWNGSVIHGLTPNQTRMLAILAQRGRASHFALYAVGAGEDADPKVVHIQICKMRRVLPRGLSIANVHGWGYALKIEEEPMTTTVQAEKTTPTMRDLAVAVASNITVTDQAAVLVVIQGDNQARVTPFATNAAGAIQVLSLGNLVLAKALQAHPAQAELAPTDKATG